MYDMHILVLFLMLQPSLSGLKLVCNHFLFHSLSSAVSSVILPVQLFLLSVSQFSGFFSHSPSSAGSSLILPVQPCLLSHSSSSARPVILPVQPLFSVSLPVQQQLLSFSQFSRFFSYYPSSTVPSIISEQTIVPKSCLFQVNCKS